MPARKQRTTDFDSRHRILDLRSRVVQNTFPSVPPAHVADSFPWSRPSSSASPWLHQHYVARAFRQFSSPEPAGMLISRHFPLRSLMSGSSGVSHYRGYRPFAPWLHRQSCRRCRLSCGEQSCRASRAGDVRPVENTSDTGHTYRDERYASAERIAQDLGPSIPMLT